MYDFSNLTEAQGLLLSFQGWSIGRHPQPRKNTVKKLIERGLLIPQKRQWNGIEITEYEVPIPVHIEWCAYCSNAKPLSLMEKD
jgi:hypothetical protein